MERSYGFNEIFLQQLLWADGHLRKGQKMMAGNVFIGYLFYFEEKIQGDVIEWPHVRDLEELQTIVRERSVDYGILDLSTAVYNMQAYQGYFDVGPRIGLRDLRDLPAPFRRVYKDPHPLSLYEIYEFSPVR